MTSLTQREASKNQKMRPLIVFLLVDAVIGLERLWSPFSLTLLATSDEIKCAAQKGR